MPGARFISRASCWTALVSLLVIAAMGQTASKTKPVKKAVTTATKRTAGKNVKVSLAGSARHTRTGSSAHEETASASTRVRSRKVVVTRKLVHGRWVRTTQIVHVDPGPTYQQHPDPERYQQIQQALAQKGYFKGEANGQWGDDSVAALKQYQTDQKIPNDGKISSLSLIDLGLGPNREGTVGKSDGGLHF